VVTLLSIVNSDACDIGFGGYNESCQSIVNSDACESLFTILNNVTTKTYVTGITIYNTQ
jgi:hypothetical protein